eukprot:208170-Chlamydomonas_euryale.AAC.4
MAQHDNARAARKGGGKGEETRGAAARARVLAHIIRPCTCRHTGRQAGRHSGRQAGRQHIGRPSTRVQAGMHSGSLAHPQHKRQQQQPTEAQTNLAITRPPHLPKCMHATKSTRRHVCHATYKPNRPHNRPHTAELAVSKKAKKSKQVEAAVEPPAEPPASSDKKAKKKAAKAAAAAADEPSEMAEVGDAELARSGKAIVKQLYKEHADVAALRGDELEALYSQRCITVEGTGIKPVLKFEQTGLPANMLHATRDFQEPSPIQSQCWPIIMSGHVSGPRTCVRGSRAWASQGQGQGKRGG